jgi:hypothetical protein
VDRQAVSAPIEVVLPQVVRDGDTLILTFARPMDRAELDALMAQLRAAIPETVQIGILDQCSGAIIYRPGEVDQD